MGARRSLWLVRHGNRLDFVQPDWFRVSPYRYDPPLCPEGHQQARELGDRLRGESIDHIFVSPFLRAVQTAYYCATTLQISPKVETGLGEWHNPDWMTTAPMLHPPTLWQQDWSIIDQTYQAYLTPSYPETLAQLQGRSQQLMQWLLTHFTGNLLIVGHKHSLLAILQGLLGEPVDPEWDVCAIHQLQWDGDRWHWLINNDSQFLSNPGIKVAPKECFDHHDPCS